MRVDLPAGTVTFLFSDIEGSTRLLHELGADAYAQALSDHRRVLREAFARHGGVEVDTQGDAFFVAFPTAAGALAAAAATQQALADGPIRVRIGLHTGTPVLTAEGYVGPDVHRAARICAAGHGGQVLVSRATEQLVTAQLTDLGEHRVKDFAQPVWIYQLGDQPFPPLRTISNTNLPRPASTFVGREREVTEIGELLRDGARLLTVTGPGGTGKTRLSIEAAGELVPVFRNGVYWVPLAALRDPALVADTIGQTLGAHDGLAEHIGEREMLLVLDNLEQVVDAAPGLAGLIESCPHLRLLVTSRERLRVRGETEYAVPPLSDREAVELFSERADLAPDDTIAELCRRLDKLPLAIELAAARTIILSPGQILERLAERLDLLKGGRDAEARQQTLRATIEWSHDLLAPEEQRLFALLAVFRGGWTLEAAEQVVDADLDTLQSLVDKSLVRVRDERLTMLETIREFAAERLEASGNVDELKDRLLEHMVNVAEQAYEGRLSDPSWSPVIEAEQDNIRAALDWAAQRDSRREAQLAGAVAFYWDLRGRGLEGLDRLSDALSRYRERDAIRARALMHLASFAFRAQLPEASANQHDAMSYIDEAVQLWAETGEASGHGFALYRRGEMRVATGDQDGARSDLETSVALLHRTGASEVVVAEALTGLCQSLVAIGDVDAAEPLAEQLRTLGRRHQSAELEASALHFLADCPLLRGDYDEAERRYRNAVAHARDHGMATQCTNDLLGVAMSLAGQGDDWRAVRLAGAAYAERERLGIRRLSPMGFWRELQERHIGAARERLGQARTAEAERAGESADFTLILDEVIGSVATDAH